MRQQHDPAWHAREAADERAWLDQWARTHATAARPTDHGTDPTIAPPAVAALAAA